LIDTPGAQHDEAAEASGIGHAIGDTFTAMAETSVPVTSVLIGEGGSGGALALAKAGSLWAAPDSYFSVIAPEAAASIVYRDRTRAPEAADYLHLGPRELVETGMANGILPAA
jgi:acetyl-CoA carboxylase alpha subunit